MLIDFPHFAPEGYSYEFEDHNTRVVAIWLRHHRTYSFAEGKSVRSIWGFYSSKKREYYAPINSSKCGDKVSISDTTPYTAMQIKRTPLESAFV
jgi:hypothetical protein